MYIIECCQDDSSGWPFTHTHTHTHTSILHYNAIFLELLIITPWHSVRQSVNSLLVWVQFLVHSVRPPICPLVTTMHFQKNDRSIEMPFGVVGCVGPRHYVLDGVSTSQSPDEKGQFWGIGWCSVKYRRFRLFPNYFGIGWVAGRAPSV